MIKQILRFFYYFFFRNKFGEFTKSSVIGKGVSIYNKRNLYMGENTNIYTGAIIMNNRARFVLKRNSGAAANLTVITGNHQRKVGRWLK